VKYRRSRSIAAQLLEQHSRRLNTVIASMFQLFGVTNLRVNSPRQTLQAFAWRLSPMLTF
jgi:hypothetical protein